MSKDAYLKAMGIEVYRLRSQGEDPNEEDSNTEAADDSDQSSITFDNKVADVAPAAERKPVPVADPLADLNMAAVEAVASTCQLCSLSRSRNRVVFGAGSETADILFIGEGPGAEEDRQGLPFVGRAGQLLTSMISALGFERSQVYICNVVKCRPPNNRDPSPEEAKACSAYLRRQIDLIQPKVIVALGRISAHLLLDTELALGRLRRQSYKFKDTDIDLVVTYHPAYLLRKPSEKAKSWDDLWKVRQLLNACSQPL